MPLVRGEDDFEILDISDKNKSWLKDTFRDISKQSVAKQIAIGGAGGWCSGYLFGKVGKAAAAAVGGSLLILQIAQHQGYITVNWTKLEKSVQKAKKDIAKKTKNSDIPAMLDQAQDFIKENMFLAGGFSAGFLLGLAS